MSTLPFLSGCTYFESLTYGTNWPQVKYMLRVTRKALACHMQFFLTHTQRLHVHAWADFILFTVVCKNVDGDVELHQVWL